MTKQQFEEWLALRERPLPQVKVLERVWNSPPNRLVGGRSSNVSGRFPSTKMGCSIQFESHTVELCQVLKMERSQHFSAFFDQPPEMVKLTWSKKSGKKVSCWSTADFFVFLSDGQAGWLECKPEEKLLSESEISDKYIKNSASTWSCPSGEEYAAPFGLFYHVVSSSDFTQTFQRNTDYLLDYITDSDTVIDDSVKRTVKALVAVKQGIVLEELFQHEGPFTRADVFYMIARDELWVDKEAHVLSRHERVPVFTDRLIGEANIPVVAPKNFGTSSELEIVVEAGRNIMFNGSSFKILSVSNEKIWLRDESNNLLDLNPGIFEHLVREHEITGVINDNKNTEVLDLINSRSPEEFERALKRMAAISPYLSKTDRNTPTTDRRWCEKYKLAERETGCGFTGLFDDVKNRGNRAKKINLEADKLLDDTLKAFFASKEAPYLKSVYAEYEAQCEEAGLKPASYKTFHNRKNAMPKESLVEERKGKRAAYQLKFTHWYLEHSTPRHGERPFEIVHIDHTQLDLELFCPKTNKSIGRPWLTIMIDAFSRRILAAYLTFEPPSTSSVMMVLRICVKRHLRLPQTIVVDNGKEFRSVYFSTFAAIYKINIKYRPPGQPRFGSVVERHFGTTHSQFIHNLKGNTKLMKNPRTVTKSFNPKNTAVWTFETISDQLDLFFYDVYDTVDHPALFESPRSAFEREIHRHGVRPIRLVPYDETFLMNTRPTTAKGTSKVSNKGVKIHNIVYSHGNLCLPHVDGQQVHVRTEPFNIGIAFAFVDGRWIRCLSEFFTELNGLTEFETRRISAEIRAKDKIMNTKTQITAKVLRDFLKDVRSAEFELVAQRRDAEGRTITSSKMAQGANDRVFETTSNPEPQMDVVPDEVYGKLNEEAFGV